jgi:hypothetical protein
LKHFVLVPGILRGFSYKEEEIEAEMERIKFILRYSLKLKLNLKV